MVGEGDVIAAEEPAKLAATAVGVAASPEERAQVRSGGIVGLGESVGRLREMSVGLAGSAAAAVAKAGSHVMAAGKPRDQTWD